MRGITFPLVKTKIKGLNRKFNLTDPEERQAYFEAKAGSEIKKLRTYLEKNPFIAYLLGKKNAGKGTYAKMFQNLIGPDLVDHLSIGDMIRNLDQEIRDPGKKEALISYLKDNYRGFYNLDEIFHSLENRSTKVLLPTELILCLTEREISRRPERKTLFIDGFPRGLDQVSYSLFFRHLIGYRDDPDIFVLIDVPEAVIDERIKYRRVCPKCNTSRNLKLLPTSKVGFDKEVQEFYLCCDEPGCKEMRMVKKEGDEKGIDLIKERLEQDEQLIKKAFSLYGVPKILLRNSVPKDKAPEICDDYEITPQYNFEYDEKNDKVIIKSEPWEIKDDNGVPSYSLMASPVVVSLIWQLADALDL